MTSSAVSPMPELVRISRLSALANTVQGILFSKNVSKYWNRYPVHGIHGHDGYFFCHDCDSFSRTMVIFGKFVAPLRTNIGQTTRKNRTQKMSWLRRSNHC